MSWASRLALLALIFAPTGSSAEPSKSDFDMWIDGNQLWETCGSTIDGHVPAGCFMYVAGSLDNYEIMKRFVGRDPVICRNQGLTPIQAADVVRRYLSEHPESRHSAAASLVFVAMAKAFPCAATAPH